MRIDWSRWIRRGIGTVALGAAAVLAGGAAAPADERDVMSRPSAVTVYPDGARVERQGEAELPAGAVTVTFADLPAAADEASLRLLVRGPAGTKFHGVRLRSAFGSKAAEARVRDLNDRIRGIEDQKAEIDDRILARNAELDILKSLGKDAAGRTGAGAAGGLAQVAEGSKAVGKRIQELLAESRKDANARRALDDQLTPLKQELAEAGAGATTKRVAEAELTMAAAGHVEFTLAYLVHDASWSPVYDLTLDRAGKEPKVAIAFAATVRQRSGEDWNNIALTLSTARPTADSRVPDPTNWWLDLWRPQPVYRKAMANRRAGVFAPEMAAAPAMAEGGMSADASEPVAMEEAQTERAMFATHFKIGSPSSIPSGVEARRVGIGESSNAAELSLVVVPRLVQAAFVEAKMTYAGDEPLLPGTANLFQGGEFVGTVALPSVGPGETVTLGFGQDPDVKVERKLRDAKDADKTLLGLGKAYRRYRWVTTLTSTHDAVRTVEVREQLPRSRNTDVIVEALDMSPTPLAEEAATPGLMKWRLDLKPAKPAQVVFAYQVKFPQGTRVSGLE